MGIAVGAIVGSSVGAAVGVAVGLAVGRLVAVGLAVAVGRVDETGFMVGTAVAEPGLSGSGVALSVAVAVARAAREMSPTDIKEIYVTYEDRFIRFGFKFFQVLISSNNMLVTELFS